MPFVDSRRACDSRACYRPHHHPTFSIGAVDRGSSVFTGAAAGPLRLRPGTVVWVPAARVHACNPARGATWSYQMLHLDADWLRRVRQEDTDSALLEAEPVRITTDPARYARFCRLNALLFSDADRCDKEAELIEFIGDCDIAHGLRIDAPSAPTRLLERLRPALECLRATPAAGMALGALAHLAGMSRYQLIRAFRTVTGLTPHAWQLNQRINLGRHLIRDGAGIADVAQRLGFADQAHFQRVFKAHVGVSPGRFRA
ncbi:AraC family transcriptional regulator [Xanthomonas campestris pv. phormiicola]|nr:AraC family transcriptional regulator [Xanthomonas campestris pv. phormiicola]UYC17893.1 AraC family transcriptional regulator [Xanthomonas campestris pv. phormiicola]